MTGFSIYSKSKKPQGVLGKILSSLPFLFFMGMGLLFVGLIAHAVWLDIRTWTWKKTNCEIVSSSVSIVDSRDNLNGKFRPGIKYRYDFDGETFIGNQFKRSDQSYSDYGKVARLIREYPAGAFTVCYVDSSAPGAAVLHRSPPYMLVFVFFPMIFVAFGVGGIYYTWKKQPPDRKPISAQASGAQSQGGLIFFFSMFTLIGGLLLFFIFIAPVFEIIQARHWSTVPCTVISSGVNTHRGSKGDTYSINIFYRYQINGTEYKANRFIFMGGSSSGYSGKQRVVRQYPAGSSAICYVNPNDPTDAVLLRGFTSEMFVGLIPLVFFSIGVGGLFYTVRSRRRAAASVTGIVMPEFHKRSSTVKSVIPQEFKGTLVLKPNLSPLTKLFVIMGMAIFWNGIVSVFVFQAVEGHRAGHTEWFLVIFLISFVLIGLGLIGGTGYGLLALFNPRPRLRMTPGAVPLGETFQLRWEIIGRIGVVRRLSIRLEGREETTSRNGKNNSNDKNVFANFEIANVTNPQDLRNGSATATIPAYLMHSFQASHNRIVWAIVVRGEIPRWPDISEEYAITVLPVAPTQTAP